MKIHGSTADRGLSTDVQDLFRTYLREGRLYREGVSPAGVVDLQQDLNRLGADPQLAEDGIYGPNTAAAVRDFQESAGVTVDGIVGPETKDALKSALADQGILVSKPPTLPGPDPTPPESRHDEQGTSRAQFSRAEIGVGVTILGGLGYYLWKEFQAD